MVFVGKHKEQEIIMLTHNKSDKYGSTFSHVGTYG